MTRWSVGLKCPAKLKELLHDPKLTYVAVAVKSGYRLSYVVRWAAELKLGPLRSNRRNYSRIDHVDMAKRIDDLRAEGLTSQAIADKLGVHYWYVRHATTRLSVRKGQTGRRKRPNP